MKTYQTVVVGTDGSDTSLRAVDKAASVAAASDAKLVIATAYSRQPDDSRAADVLKDEAYLVHGAAPVYAMLRGARDRAKAAGANNVEERALVGGPVGVLVDVAEQVDADLLVVGNVGLDTFAGRMFGSVARGVSRRAKTEVLVVPTTN
jgi:nucleotide-binding universal stress UspA family protein